MNHPDMLNLTDIESDPNEGMFLVWLLPVTTTLFCVSMLSLCSWMGWLQ